MLFPPDFLDRVAAAAGRARRYAGIGEGPGRRGRLGEAGEFADHRPYAPGDDARRLDWALFARHGELSVRRFAEDRGRPMWALLDASASMAAGDGGLQKWDAARTVAAAACCGALLTGGRAGALGFGGKSFSFPESRGAAAAGAALRFFKELEPGGGGTVGDAADSFLSARPRAGAVAVVSDFLDAGGFAGPLDRLRAAGHAVRAVRVYTAEEARPGVRGDAALVDAETGAAVTRTITKDAAAAYAARYNAFAASFIGAGGLAVRADVGLDELIAAGVGS